jgi:hypothetical protein
MLIRARWLGRVPVLGVDAFSLRRGITTARSEDAGLAVS